MTFGNMIVVGTCKNEKSLILILILRPVPGRKISFFLRDLRTSKPKPK